MSIKQNKKRRKRRRRKRRRRKRRRRKGRRRKRKRTNTDSIFEHGTPRLRGKRVNPYTTRPFFIIMITATPTLMRIVIRIIMLIMTQLLTITKI